MFNYKEFAKSMAEQCDKLMPKDLSDNDKKFLKDTLYEYTNLAGEALNNDTRFGFNDDNKILITQLVVEWTFHKIVDLAKSGIPKEHWLTMLQKIAFTVFEVAKQGLIKNIEEEQLLQAVEHHVVKVYKKEVLELHKKKIISDGIKEKALKQSNVDAMADEAKSGEKKENNPDKEGYSHEIKRNIGSTITSNIAQFFKEYKSAFNCGTMMFITMLIIVSFFSQFNINSRIVSSICIPIALLIISYPYYLKKTENINLSDYDKWVLAFLLGMAFCVLLLVICIISGFASFCQNLFICLNSKIGFGQIFIVLITLMIMSGVIYKVIQDKRVKKELEKLNNIRQQMQDLVNPDKMYERLGVDIITVIVAQNLLPLVDPDNDGLFLPKVAALRHRMADELGYIIPTVRIMDNTEFNDNEYSISIRDNVVATGVVYPDKYMVIADQWETAKKIVPDNAIIGVDPIYQTQAYWLSEDDTKSTEGVTVTESADVIIKHLEKVLIKNVDFVMEESDIPKYIDTAKNGGFILSDKLLEKLEYNDIKDVFANLIREDISIKDITFVLSKLENYSRYHKEPDILSEMIRKDLSRQISFANCEEDKTLYAINLSSELTHKLLENIEFQHDYNKTVLNMDKDDEQKLVKNVATKLMEGHMKTNVQPVLVCNEKLRLSLYRLLVNHIPTILVMAENEIVPDIEVKYTDTI